MNLTDTVSVQPPELTAEDWRYINRAYANWHETTGGTADPGDAFQNGFRAALLRAAETYVSPARALALFQEGNFTLNSGKRSIYKIECDAMTSADWAGVAAMAQEENLLGVFGAVLGVPRGGVPFAAALQRYMTPGSRTLLIAEDVVTTGGSMERYRCEIKDYAAQFERVIGICFVARGKCPEWVRPVLRGPGA